MTRALSGGGGHHHGGGGWRGSWGPYGYGTPYNWQYPQSEIIYVEQPKSSSQVDEWKTRAMALIMSMPKGKRAAAYQQVFGKEPPPGALGYMAERKRGNIPLQARAADAYGGLDGYEFGQQLTWKGKVPSSATMYRAGETRDLGGILETPIFDLPKAGAPEPLPRGMAGDCGCGCKGAGTCKSAMGDIADMVTMKNVAIGVGAYLVYKHLKKKR